MKNNYYFNFGRGFVQTQPTANSPSYFYSPPSASMTPPIPPPSAYITHPYFFRAPSLPNPDKISKTSADKESKGCKR